MPPSLPPILCFVGRSNSGKTTLIERLIPMLVREGYRIATIKHAGHGFDLDTEGKDSWRLKRAGSKTVSVTSKGSLAVVVVAVLGMVAAAVAIPLTSAPKFCATCHTIKHSYDSWVKSSHKEVTCVACHVRPTFEGFIQDKVIKGTHDVWVTFFGTPKKP